MTDESGRSEKLRTITLTKDASEEAYRVEKITDSIEYAPGTFLSPAQVQGLCDDSGWKVTIQRNKGK